MDLIYVAAYAAVGLTYLRVIYTANQIHHHGQSRHDYVQGDRKMAAGIAVAFVMAVVVMLAT
jgi:hypothetical protein